MVSALFSVRFQNRSVNQLFLNKAFLNAAFALLLYCIRLNYLCFGCVLAYTGIKISGPTVIYNEFEAGGLSGQIVTRSDIRF